MEHFPDPVALFNRQTKRIGFANLKLAHLSFYSLSELSKLEIGSLLPDFDAIYGGDQSSPQPFSQSLALLKKDHSTEPVQLSAIPLNSKDDWWLISLLPQSSQPGNIHNLGTIDSLWMVFEAFYHATQSKNLNEALDIVLSATSELTNADAVCIYQANSQELILNRVACFGNCRDFPISLAPQELALLREPSSWAPGKRANSVLHHVAQGAGWKNLTTLPIGEANATIGLFVIGARESTLLHVDLLQLQLLANFIASLIQKHSQLSTLTRTLEEFKLENSLYQLVENQIKEGSIILSSDLQVISMNKAAEEILGYSCQDICSQPATKILVSDQDISDLFTIPVNENNPTEEQDFRLYRRSGQSFPAGIKVLPVPAKEKNYRWIFIFWDKTEDENIQAQIKRLEQQAFLGQFQTGFAHEVRNPINNISTGLQLMALNLPSDDPNQDAIARLKQDCDRLTDLMNTILSYTWTNENRMEQIDLGQLVSRVIDRFTPKLSQANIKHPLQIDEALPQVWGNRRALEQVFINLVDNAIRVMKEKGDTLAIRISPIPDQENRQSIEVSVADNGPGIPKEELERLFLPYFTTSQSGTGLGLAISKKIINGHRGSIHAESFPGGTIFYVRIPAYHSTITQ